MSMYRNTVHSSRNSTGRYCLVVVSFFLTGLTSVPAESLNLNHAVVVVREGELPAAEKMASTMLTEETSRRTQLSWKTSMRPGTGDVEILLAQARSLPEWKSLIPVDLLQSPELTKPESYCIRVVPQSGTSRKAQVIVLGADPRGVMFGVGQLLRRMDLLPGQAAIDSEFSISTSPDRTIRGHQIGYRPRANSWDAWTIEQFDQYFRDMVVFGANCIENIPLEDRDPGPLMKYPRDEMNVQISKLCQRYDLDHWVWIPVEFPVEDPVQSEAFLKRQDEFYRSCVRLDAVFVPGGDPGNNPCSPLMPYLRKMSETLQKHHPHAKVWLSLQGFRGKDIDDFFQYVAENQPDWLGGAVMGPSSPPMEMTRKRLPAKYRLRWYPDITHNVRCQYPIPWLDPVWGITVGREGVNPRPEDFTGIYRNDYRLTDGFLSYSDGIHDDFNKNLWSQMGWDPNRPVREITEDYARYFFRSDLGDLGADALTALEMNLRGPAIANGSVEGTWRLWKQIIDSDSMSGEKWRVQMHGFRALYDVYVRRRLIHETQLEQQALSRLNQATGVMTSAEGVSAAVQDALGILRHPDTHPAAPDVLKQVEEMADHLFRTIGYQTSVPRYQASGYERGCMMDYVNYPLNNRWWLEDQLAQVEKLSGVEEKKHRLLRLINWENPGPDGYYEMLGNVGRSFHVTKLQNAGDVMRRYRETPIPTQKNMDPDRQSLRLAWHVYIDSLPPLRYTGLNPGRRYTVRLFAQRDSPLVIDGVPARLLSKGETFGAVTEQEFEVPSEAVADGVLELTWAPLDERHLNWRNKHYVTDLWIQSH